MLRTSQQGNSKLFLLCTSPLKNHRNVEFKTAPVHQGLPSYTQCTLFPFISIEWMCSRIRLQRLSSFLPHLLVDLQNIYSLKNLCKVHVHWRFIPVLIYNVCLLLSEVLTCIYQSMSKILGKTEWNAWNFFSPATLSLSCPFLTSFCFILVCSVSSNVFAIMNHQVCFLLLFEVSDLNVKAEEQVQLIARCFFLKYSLALFQSPAELFYETRWHDYQLLRGRSYTSSVTCVVL